MIPLTFAESKEEDFHEKSLFFLASLGAAAVKAGPSGKNFPRGIRIVIDVENQL
jgi:hypothetical protein